jgi:hypothetical protein
MARPDGVVIVSERFWALATTEGVLREGEMPAVRGFLSQIPLLRGLVKLASALSPILRTDGIARARERWLLGTAMIATFTLVLLPHLVASVGEVTLTAVLLGWMLRGRTLFLHGAEHRAISAAEQRHLSETWHGRAHPSRFAARCGTNFAALVLPVAAVLDHLSPRSAAAYAPIVVALLALALTMELWRLIQQGGGWMRPLLFPGLALQRLTTREPRLDETRVALTALASVVRRELEVTIDPRVVSPACRGSAAQPHEDAARHLPGRGRVRPLTLRRGTTQFSHVTPKPRRASLSCPRPSLLRFLQEMTLTSLSYWLKPLPRQSSPRQAGRGWARLWLHIAPPQPRTVSQ